MIEPWGARLARVSLALAVLALALWIGVRAAQPPSVLPATAPATAFSAARAMVDVRAIAMRPHPAGTAADDKVAAILLARLRALGLRAEARRYLADERTIATLRAWSGGAVDAVEITNVVGVLPGRDPARPALLLMAHHDTVWGSPGAPDDSAGVAAILEAVRAIRARGVPARDVVVLFTDAEETGLNGVRAFWDGGGLAGHVGTVVNLDVRGGGGRATMFETGARDGDAMRLFARAVNRPSANSLAAFAYAHMPNNTDFSVPRDRGLPGFDFAFMGRPRYYHSPLATIDRLDPRSLQDIGAQALGIASALAFADTLPARGANTVYFDLPGGYFVRYAPGRGWLLLLVAAAGLAIAWMRCRPAAAGAGAGAAVLVWLLATGSLLLPTLNLLSGSDSDPNYYDRLAALPALEWQAGLALAALALAGFALRGGRGRWLAALPGFVLMVLALRLGVGAVSGWIAGLAAMAAGAMLPVGATRPRDEWLGMLALLLVAGIVAQVRLPYVAWAIHWPLAAMAIAAGLGARPLPVAAIAAGVGAALIPLAHLVFLGLGAGWPIATLPFAVIAIVAVWPLARVRASSLRLVAIVAGAPLAAAIAIAHHVRSDPMAPTVPAYSIASAVVPRAS